MRDTNASLISNYTRGLNEVYEYNEETNAIKVKKHEHHALYTADITFSEAACNSL
jgi:hypothetical protein